MKIQKGSCHPPYFKNLKIFHHQATGCSITEPLGFGVFGDNFLVSNFLFYFPSKCWMQQQKKNLKIFVHLNFAKTAISSTGEGPTPEVASWDTFCLNEPHLWFTSEKNLLCLVWGKNFFFLFTVSKNDKPPLFKKMFEQVQLTWQSNRCAM